MVFVQLPTLRSMFLVIVYILAVSSALEVEAGVSLGEPWGGQASHISLPVMECCPAQQVQ